MGAVEQVIQIDPINAETFRAIEFAHATAKNIADELEPEQRTPEFYALLQEYFDLKAMQAVPSAKNPTEAWDFIKFHNLMDSLQTHCSTDNMQ